MKRSPLYIIYLTIFIDLIGFGIVIPVLPIYAQRFGASPIVVGFLLASFSLFQLFATPILGQLSDRYGRRPVLFLSLLGTSAAFLMMGLADTLWLLFVARILDGITGGNISTAQAYIADVTTPENRARSLGMMGAAFGLGFIIGPALGGLLSHYGLAVPFLFAAGLALANAIILYFRLPETITPDHPARFVSRSLWTIFSVPRELTLRLILAVYFVATIAFAGLTATLALYTSHAAQFAYDATHNGYLFVFFGLVGAIVQGGLLGRLVKRFGETTLAIAGIIFLGSGLLVLPYATGLVGLLFALTLISNGHGLVTPSLTALASRRTSASHQGSILGVTQSLNSLARIVGPIMGTMLLEASLKQATGSATPLTRVSGALMAPTFLVGSALAGLALVLAFYFRSLVGREIKASESSESGVSPDLATPRPNPQFHD